MPTTEHTHDWPVTLAGAHGRISAYRAALAEAEEALAAVVPYVYNVAHDPSNSPWRTETAFETMGKINNARNVIHRELKVTNP